MTLSSATLASELEALTPTGSEATAIANLTAAWGAYFGESTVSGATAVPGSYAAGLSAMQAAMVGLSAPNGAAAAIQAGVVAFWSAIAALPTSIWTPTAPVVLVPPIVPPANITTLAATLPVTFGVILSGSLSLPAAAAQIASTIHTAVTSVPATVLGSVPPATPVPLPVL